MRRLRVAYVIPTLGAGGTETQLLHLVQALSGSCDVGVICTRREGVLIGEVRRHAAHVHVLDALSGWDFRVDRRLRDVFASRKPDVVHTFLSGFDLFANRAARAVGVPVVVSSRRELATWQKGRHRMMQRRANVYVDKIVANSKAVAAYAIAHEPVNASLFQVIYNGVDCGRFRDDFPREKARAQLRLPENGFIVGMAANFSPVKDHALFLQVASRIRKVLPDSHFVLVGKGPLLDKVKGELASSGMRPAFSIIHAGADMLLLYRAMDVSVLCSKDEGFPNVILESMACGTPVVAAAVGGIPEQIRDGDNGCLVEGRDPDRFAQAIVDLLHDKERRATFSRHARRDVEERFSLESMVQSHRSLYESLLREKRGEA